MLFVETDKLVDFLTKNKLTVGQFMFCYLTYTKDWKNIYRYNEETVGFNPKELADLEERGLVRNLNKDGEDFCDMYIISQGLFKNIYIDLDVAGEELWETYPPFLYVDTKRVPARSCDKDALIKTYLRRIKNSKKKHEAVLTTLKKAITEDRVSMGIEKWVTSAQWESLEQEEARGKVDFAHDI